MLPVWNIVLVCVQGLQKPEGGTGSPGTVATDLCELLSELWKLSMSLLKSQGVFLTHKP